MSRRRILLLLVVLLLGAGGALAWRIHTWGRPLPVAYRRIEVTPPNPGQGRSFTYLRVDKRPEAPDRTVGVDSTGDGTIDFVVDESRSPARFPRPRPDTPGARWLVLCLDGVPYQELLALWEEGYFREFFRPVPLISPFPSDSESALTDSFHTAPVPGYEHRYFDRRRNELAGGALATVTGEDIPYLDLLDYDMPGYLKGIAYILPRKSYRADLGRLRRRFLESDDRVFVAHLASSDSLYHILPRAEMRRLLKEVDALLRELYFDAGGKLRVTLFSDHGNSLARSHRIDLESFLAERGWRLRDHLEGARDVAVPAYGLVGFFAAYCRPEARPELAAALAELPAADVVVYREGAGVEVLSAGGRARLEWRKGGEAFRYIPQEGDPLALAPILETLEENGKVQPGGWVREADLFAATADHRYPDPGYRLWQWATDHVENRADVMVSLKPGYFYGSDIFHRIVDIYSTHGALDRPQSVGFATSTDGPLAAPIRASELLPQDLPVRERKDERE